VPPDVQETDKKKIKDLEIELAENKTGMDGLAKLI